MNKYLGTIPIALLVVCLIGCNKPDNKKWLYADIEVRDAISKELVEADLFVSIEYQGENDPELVSVGSTTNGAYLMKKEFPKKLSSAYLVARGTEYYYSEGSYQSESDYTYLDIHGPNNMTTLWLYPIYRMEVSFDNVNCYDTTDSLRVVVQIPDDGGAAIDTLTGCYQGTPSALPIWSEYSYLSWLGLLKRNGVETTLETLYEFEPHIVNQILVEY